MLDLIQNSVFPDLSCLRRPINRTSFERETASLLSRFVQFLVMFDYSSEKYTNVWLKKPNALVEFF